VLENYGIDAHRARLEKIMATVVPSETNQNGPNGTMKTCQSITSRTQDQYQPLITDDNMGEEWQRFSIRTFARGMISIVRNLWGH
jgi:hypothetical protein